MEAKPVDKADVQMKEEETKEEPKVEAPKVQVSLSMNSEVNQALPSAYSSDDFNLSFICHRKTKESAGNVIVKSASCRQNASVDTCTAPSIDTQKPIIAPLTITPNRKLCLRRTTLRQHTRRWKRCSEENCTIVLNTV